MDLFKTFKSLFTRKNKSNKGNATTMDIPHEVSQNLFIENVQSPENQFEPIGVVTSEYTNIKGAIININSSMVQNSLITISNSSLGDFTIHNSRIVESNITSEISNDKGDITEETIRNKINEANNEIIKEATLCTLCSSTVLSKSHSIFYKCLLLNDSKVSSSILNTSQIEQIDKIAIKATQKTRNIQKQKQMVTSSTQISQDYKLVCTESKKFRQIQSISVTKVKSEYLNHLWRIEKFNYHFDCNLFKQPYLESNKFPEAKFNEQIQFFIRLYPNGFNEEHKDYVSVVILMDNSKAEAEIVVECNLYLQVQNEKNINEIVVRENLFQGKSIVIYNYILRSELMNLQNLFAIKDELRLFCEIELLQDSITMPEKGQIENYNNENSFVSAVGTCSIPSICEEKEEV